MARILIADNDHAVAEDWRRALEREGHDVFVQMNGAETLRLASRLPPDLVIAELVMAGGGGLALGGRLKLIASDIKVIITSGHPAALDPAVDGLRLARRAGADLALAKPVRTDALVDAVRDLLAGAAVDHDAQSDIKVHSRQDAASTRYSP